MITFLTVSYDTISVMELSTSTLPATWLRLSHTLCVQQATSHSLCLTSAASFWQISDNENNKINVKMCDITTMSAAWVQHKYSRPFTCTTLFRFALYSLLWSKCTTCRQLYCQRRQLILPSIFCYFYCPWHWQFKYFT